MRDNQKIFRFVKDSTGASLKEKGVAKCGRPDKGLSSRSRFLALNIAIVVRHQTADEQHRFKSATDALLTELVRQHLSLRSNQ